MSSISHSRENCGNDHGGNLLRRRRPGHRRRLSSCPRGAGSIFFTLASIILTMTMTSFVVDAKVTLVQYNESFISMPAMFGGQLSVDEPPVVAHLVYMKDRPLMCAESTQEGNIGDEDDDGSISTNNNTTTTSTTMTSGSSSSSSPSPGSEQEDTIHTTTPKIQTPDDGLPVALLVGRGQCTFWEKSVEASKLGDSIQYVVVFDNEMSEDLVPMSSEFQSNMTLFFVSMMSGHEIRDLILQKMTSGYPYDPETSGILVEIDGEAPPMPEWTDGPRLNLAAYFLAAMSGFLAFLVFFGCILIFAQCGFIVAHPDERGRIVLFANGARPHIGGGGGNGSETAKHLLTTEQVMSLDEIEYEADHPSKVSALDNNDGDVLADEEGSSCCCAICLDEFEDKEKARRLPCKHLFHEDCLVPWLTERHASCPMCKFDVLQHILDAEKGADTKKDGDQIDSSPDNTHALEAESGEATTTASRTSPSPSLHVMFWNRISFGGWTRIREDSQSEEETERRRASSDNLGEQQEQQQQQQQQEQLEQSQTTVELTTVSSSTSSSSPSS